MINKEEVVVYGQDKKIIFVAKKSLSHNVWSVFDNEGYEEFLMKDVKIITTKNTIKLNGTVKGFRRGLYNNLKVYLDKDYSVKGIPFSKENFDMSDFKIKTTFFKKRKYIYFDDYMKFTLVNPYKFEIEFENIFWLRKYIREN